MADYSKFAFYSGLILFAMIPYFKDIVLVDPTWQPVNMMLYAIVCIC